MHKSRHARSTGPAGWAALGGLLLAVHAAGYPVAAQSRPQTRSQAQPAAYYPGPGDDWERRMPEQVGMDARLLEEAIAFAKATESKNPRDLALEHEVLFGREPHSEAIGPFKTRGDMTGIILRHGYLVAEWGEPARVDMTFSMTKSFLSTTVGLAYDRGLIRDLNHLVQAYVPTDEFASAHNRTITWDHLLRQTSDWEGTLWGKPDWADRPPAQGSLLEYVNRARNAPGTSYKYNDVRVNVLCPGWIETSFGEQADPDFRRAVAQSTPLGRWGRPQDVAQAALYLASPGAAFVTGQAINVNGGVEDIGGSVTYMNRTNRWNWGVYGERLPLTFTPHVLDRQGLAEQVPMVRR